MKEDRMIDRWTVLCDKKLFVHFEQHRMSSGWGGGGCMFDDERKRVDD